MSENVRVVAHHLNGKILKGTAAAFTTEAPSFQICPQGQSASTLQDVHFEDLKAVFFVRDLNGNSKRPNIKGFLRLPGSTPQGIKIAVRFRDGEVLCGYSYTHTKGSDGFFLFPSDTTSNNLRVYVLVAATLEVAVGPAADTMVRAVSKKRSA